MGDIKRLDIVDIELNSGNLHRSWLNHSIGSGDNNANGFGVRLFRNGEPVNIGAGWVQGFFRNSQGENIALTEHGAIAGNEAYVVLPQACYNYDGPFTLAIKLVSEGSTNTVTMRIVDGMVDNTNTGSAVAPTGTVPTYQEILAVYAEMQEDIADYESVVATQNGKIDDLKSALDLNVKYFDGIIAKSNTANLVVVEALIPDYWYHYSNGELSKITDVNKYYAYPIIPVTGGGTYTTQGIQLLSYYDSNKDFISYESVASNYAVQHTMPNNCAYVGITTRENYLSIVGFYEGTYSGQYVKGERLLTTAQVAGLDEYLTQKLDGECGKNLFDKSGIHTSIKTGYYRGYYNGLWTANSDYEVAIMRVDANAKYSVNTANTHVCYFSDESAIAYIDGFLANATNGYTFTTPANVKTISLSFPISSNNTFQIEKGENVTNYEDFVFGLSANKIIGSTGNLLRVGANAQYNTIQSAINSASDGDTILIDAGTYTEALELTNKTLHLIGSGKNATIVTYAGDDYYYPPLEIASGIVENMTFKTTATQKAEGAIDTAYCVHIDYDAEANKSLQFINCHFESPIRPTVGIGLRENFTLNFTNCSFKSSVYPVYCHEQQASNKTGQRIELINCSIQCTGAMSAIHLQETRAYTGNVVTILMQRCIAKANGVSGNNIISAVTYPNNLPPTGSHYLNLDSFYLDTMSALNNENILNA